MNYLNLIFRLKNYPIKRAIKKLDEIQKLNVNDISQYHERKKWEIFKHHINNNSSYSKFIKNIDPTNWSQIPILTKSDIQLPLIDRLSEGYSRRKVYVNNTSGSTGKPFYFAKDKFYHALSWLITCDRLNWHNIKKGVDLQARFYGIPLNRTNYYKELAKDKMLSRIRFPVFDLSTKVLDNYVKLFQKKPFFYVNGYTNSLVMMAKHCIERKIVIKEICPTLQSVVTTSEVCDSIDRKILEEGFGVKIINEYGAAELDIIAFEDVNRDWLINYETMYIEILNDENKMVIPGEEGRVVVTSLYNKAMPFIRYDLGDRVIIKDKMKGNYQILDTVVGRTNDFAVLPSGKKSPGFTFYYVSKKLLEEGGFMTATGGFMKEFVVRQKKINHFHIEYDANRKINNNEKITISKAMDLYLEKGLKLTFEKKDSIKRTESGKLKHFYSDLEE